MGTLDSGKLRKIFKTINLSNETRDIELFRREVLNTIAKIFNVDKAAFALQNEDAGFPDFVRFNIDDLEQKKYRKYGYRIDPFGIIKGNTFNFKLTHGPLHERVAVRLGDLISSPSLHSSEYFNDLLRPMNIYHEVDIYLKSKGSVRGFIGLFRHAKSKDFSVEDVELMRAMSPYLTTALENMDLRSKSELDGTIVEIIGGQHPYGLILLNESINLIYMNQKAKWFCEELNENYSGGRKGLFSIPEVLIKDCRAIKEQTKRESGIFSILPINKVVNSMREKYSVTTRMLDNNMNPGMKNIFVVLVEKINTFGLLNEEKVQELLQLTKREAEIVFHLFEGEKNSEIAEKLFISEKTVKRHIQNVSDKIGVRNRTGIMHKVLNKLNVI